MGIKRVVATSAVLVMGIVLIPGTAVAAQKVTPGSACKVLRVCPMMAGSAADKQVAQATGKKVVEARRQALRVLVGLEKRVRAG